MNGQTCGNCRFIHRGRYGYECRRFPPTATQTQSRFPDTASDNWCGEWAAPTGGGGSDQWGAR